MARIQCDLSLVHKRAQGTEKSAWSFHLFAQGRGRFASPKFHARTNQWRNFKQKNKQTNKIRENEIPIIRFCVHVFLKCADILSIQFSHICFSVSFTLFLGMQDRHCLQQHSALKRIYFSFLVTLLARLYNVYKTFF